MSRALIGYTGFVGSTLLRQAHFDDLYRSTNIAEVRGRSYGLVISAGAPAQKWLANRNPEDDLAQIQALMGHLDLMRASTFVLISTVDVFKDPVGVDESSPVETEGLHPYGRHRYLLEQFVVNRFPKHLIVRLPGLVGPGLRKNAIFDLHNDNNVGQLCARAKYQFYPMVNLWRDIRLALAHGLDLVHLTAAPLSIREVAVLGFSKAAPAGEVVTPPNYDMRTLHPACFGATSGPYQYSARESLLAIRAFAQSEPHTRSSFA